MLTDTALSVHVAVPGCHILTAGALLNINTYADTVAVSKAHGDSGIFQALQISTLWETQFWICQDKATVFWHCTCKYDMQALQV